MPKPSKPERTEAPAKQIDPVVLVTPTNPATALVAAMFAAIKPARPTAESPVKPLDGAERHDALPTRGLPVARGRAVGRGRR